MTRTILFSGLFALGSVCALCAVPQARAANVLVVSDAGADTNIATALMADGHTVTTVSRDFSGGSTATLRGDLSAYDVVFWSASGGGSGDIASDAMMFTNLTTYVMSGGYVFVTGYDSIASPVDPMLCAFIGGASSRDVPGEPGPITMTPNVLNTGVVDIRGMTPTGHSGDRDALTGLTAEATAVATTASSPTEAQWVLRALGAGFVAYVSNGDSGASSHVSWTTAGNVYNSAIRNFAFNADRGMREPGAPLIEFSGEFSSDEGLEITVTATITDEEGDTFDFSWDLDDDGEFGEAEGMATYTIPAGTTDGPGVLRVGVRAVDSAGNTNTRYRALGVVNVDPSIESMPPSLVASVGAAWVYDVVVAEPGGTLDPLTFVLSTSPAGMVVSPGGRITWTPNERDVTGPGETVDVELQVADDDMGMTTQAWTMTVSPNRAPTPPRLIFPIGGAALTSREPRLVVENATDQDRRDTLTYFFEMDTVPTFDSPALRMSGPVDQTVGFTFWYPGELEPGAYYWRAWVSDGTVQTEPGSDSFAIAGVVSADAGELPDGGVVPADATSLLTPAPADEGCGCRAGSSREGLGSLVLAVLVGLLLRRRRT
jgi:MYXO-CTERM domain-containing protein